MRLFTKKKQNLLELEIESVLNCMKDVDPGTEEYSTMNENLERLYKAKGIEQPKAHISPDTMVIVAGNLLGILLILGYENRGIITSKAINFVLKGRV